MMLQRFSARAALAGLSTTPSLPSSSRAYGRTPYLHASRIFEDTGAHPGMWRALPLAPRNSRSAHHVACHDGPWPLVIRAEQHLADGYLLMADG